MRTSEFVTPRHPDKMCDQVSDAVLDYCLTHDPYSRVACESAGKGDLLYIFGEITTNAELGDKLYTHLRDTLPFLEGIEIMDRISKQSSEIAQGVDIGGAGDQGIMRGYAIAETPELMPLDYVLARDLCKFIYNRYPHDGKTQVTLNQDGSIETIVASFQGVEGRILGGLVKDFLQSKDTIAQKIYCNPAGDWNIGGWVADSGLTGRKLCIDNYGAGYPVGGGAFSGKDSTKVDRSGAYKARQIAVDVLKKTGAFFVDVEIAYAIGKAEPVEATARVVSSPGGTRWVEDISKYNLKPQEIINDLDLRKPQFLKTAQWGHFGNDFIWDRPL